MNSRLFIIKYFFCTLVFASAAAMDHNFPAEPKAALGRNAATELKAEPSKQLTQYQTAPTTSAKVTIGSL